MSLVLAELFIIVSLEFANVSFSKMKTKVFGIAKTSTNTSNLFHLFLITCTINAIRPRSVILICLKALGKISHPSCIGVKVLQTSRAVMLRLHLIFQMLSKTIQIAYGSLSLNQKTAAFYKFSTVNP